MFQVLRDLGPYLRRHRRQYVIGAIAVVLTALFTTVSPRILAAAIDEIRLGESSPASLLRWGGLVMGAALLGACFSLLQRRQMIVASRQVETELRDDLYAHLSTLDRSFYDRSRTGDLMNRLASDLLSVRELLGPGLNAGSRTLLVTLAALVGMITLQPALGALVSVAIPVMVVAATVMRRLIGQRYQRAQAKLSEIAARAQENFSGARVVRGYAVEARELGHFDRLTDDYVRLNLALARVESPMPALMGMLMAFASLAILLVGGRMVVLDGTLTVGQYVAFTAYLTMLANPVVAIGQLLNMIQRAVTSWDRLKDILEETPEVADSGRTDPRRREVRGEIELEDVTLRVGGRTLLDRVSLRVPAGGTLGVTGRTGSGKSLLAALVTRQLDPTRGRVLIDGTDAREIPLETLREACGVVAQEPFLFSESLAENVSFGLPGSRRPEGGEPELETVRWAAGVADLARDVEAFPKGYDTVLGERGVTLSGGQRQRTALARAIARRPRILILDDALSAVDTETESRILGGLREVLRDRTVILVSHRASALRQADRVVVLEDGRIVEEGAPAELAARGGRYAELERLQRLAEEAEPPEPDVPAVDGGAEDDAAREVRP